MMAGYIRSEGQVLSRSQIRKSLQRINSANATDHERRRRILRQKIVIDYILSSKLRATILLLIFQEVLI